ncbi:hypothetical protein OS493_020724 [Desmophyllum pertusum]|uniref:Uncharacterized protein n=1 Tax=Desmophyllum pertusum TaxID=174260 RepID=A0A9W9YMT3_9CNID|nr:hypothetical protein OS493_020724 [Desmophyllum pertusum]
MWEELFYRITINSSSCEASCRFLTQLQNFSSILDGDGSIPPTPNISIVTNKTFTSISLRWDPVHNTSGTPVYLIAMDITGDFGMRTPFYLIEVFTVPQATLKTVLLCALVDSNLRAKFNGIFYKFHIAVLTENSSISYGAQTLEISLPQPAPVSNVALTSLAYDNASNPKLKLTASWTQSEPKRRTCCYKPRYVLGSAMSIPDFKQSKSGDNWDQQTGSCASSSHLPKAVQECESAPSCQVGFTLVEIWVVV